MDAYGNRRFHGNRSRSKSPVNTEFRSYNNPEIRHQDIESEDCRSSPKWKHDRDGVNDRNKYERVERNIYNSNDQNVFNRSSYDTRDNNIEEVNRGHYNDYRAFSRERLRSRSRDHSVEKRDFDHKHVNKQRDVGSEDHDSRERTFSDYNDFNRHQSDKERNYNRERNKDNVHDREYSRYDRRRDREKDRGRSRSKDRGKSRSRSRDRFKSKSRSRERERDRSRRHSRDRDRRDGRRDDDREKRYYNDDEATINILERQNVTEYKNQTPNKTIMIRGLAQHITENDIRQDLVMCGFTPKEIRHVRNRRTGASRGFAFVEFPTLEESIQWMEMKQGSLMLQNKYRGALVYSIPKDATCVLLDKSSKTKAGWHCVKCATHNFRRRSSCYGCSASRVESEDGGCGNDEVSQYATKTIMLRNLDALTTEDSVMSMLKTVVPDMIKYINGVLIGRDHLTQTSRGICYLDMETTVEALSLHGALTGLESPLIIDGKTVTISYCKYRMGDLNEIFPQVAFGSAATAQTYTMNDLNALADYSASRYAKTPAQYQHYYEYYKNYFAQQISQGQAISLAQDSQANSVNAAAAVAHSAMLQRQRKMAGEKGTFRMPNGTDNRKYPIPEINSYMYDETTGYYYDSSTGLYYDANSQYYYNSVIQKYLYWDGSQSTYVLAPTQTSTVMAAAPTLNVPAGPSATNTLQNVNTDDKDKKKNKLEKTDKAKVAKKIAKDMERWAKTMTKNKEAMRCSAANESMGNPSSSNLTAGSADIGFAVLEKKAAVNSNNCFIASVSKSMDVNDLSSASQQSNSALVAAYGGGSDTSGDEDSTAGLVEGLDWDNMICMLCKRKFSSKEGLAKHQKVSELHRTNLEQYCLQHGIDKDKGQTMKYRDRAKERREKFGESDDPVPSKLKEKYLKSREAVEPVAVSQPQAPIGSDNVGNKLLQKMGWSEGQGLGKSNQGRTTIIQAERLVSNVGLGAKSNTYTALPGESYKDVVKKMMYARYQEINDR